MIFSGVLRERGRVQHAEAECGTARHQQAAGYSRLTCGHLTLSRRLGAAEPAPPRYRRFRCLPLYSIVSLCNINEQATRCIPQPSFQAMSDVVRLEYRNVTMRFVERSGKSLTAVEGVSLAVGDGEVVSLIGPSGCGKSTLLNIGSGLCAPSEGEAFVDGERVEGPNAHVAFMLQKDLLLPWRTVLENVMFGVEIQGLPAGGAQAARAGAAGKSSICSSSPATIRTSCRAACGNASRWRARSRSILPCCCSTSRSRRSMRRPGWCSSASSRKPSNARARPRC